MRQRRGGSGEQNEFPSFPIGPVLVLYGGDDPPEGYGERPYRCPFHGDSSASATVKTIDEQWFNCHAGKDCPTGNAVQILMKQENLEYKEAVQRAAEITGASNPGVRQASRRSGRMAGGSRSGSGVRSFKRTWRSD